MPERFSFVQASFCALYRARRDYGYKESKRAHRT
jgi:hypothetical protein